MIENTRYINDRDNDPYVRLIGKITLAKTTNGKQFCAKLININGRELWFETKNGRLVMNSRDDILYLSELVEAV